MRIRTATFCVALLATTLNLGAKTIQWPEKDPSFRMTFPDGWKCEPKPEGGLYCQAEDKSGLHVNFTSTKWKSEEHAKAGLAAFAGNIAASPEFKEVEQGKLRETMSSGKVKLFRLEVAGQMNGIGIESWVVAFQTGNNPYVGLSGAMARGNAEHKKRIDQILDSIAPVADEERAERRETSARGFDPYKGSLRTLLPAEFSNAELSALGIKFKQVSASDRTSSWKRQGVGEAVRFNYNLVSMVTVKIEGELVNFSTSSEAVAALKAMATENEATVASKGNGQRFSAKNGRMVVWTNGSLLCVVIGGTDPAAINFEKAAPF